MLLHVGGFLLVRYCDIEWQILVVQLSLTLGYICIEIIGRYFTFKFYTKQHYFNDADYFLWSNQSKSWEPIEEQNIKVGQIIKIKNKSSANVEESQQVGEEAKLRVPVNLLPMSTPSAEKQVSIETFDIDKQEAAVNIQVLKNFDQYFIILNKQINYVKPRITDECLIQYTFFNPIS